MLGEGTGCRRGQELQEPRSQGAAAVKRFDPALKREKKYKRKACRAEITARQLQPRPLPRFGVAQARPKGWGKAGLVPLAGDSQGNPAGGFFFLFFYDHASPSKEARGEIQSLIKKNKIKLKAIILERCTRRDRPHGPTGSLRFAPRSPCSLPRGNVCGF